MRLFPAVLTAVIMLGFCIMARERERLDKLQTDICSSLELLKISADANERRTLLAEIRQMVEKLTEV